ncbi:hypothetical protein [Actinobacillus vicugnae]|uniref:hypothetical protein n=1 Tax=Actinobacillus vicugnae TaxID=2573093 RepID=UPI001FCB6B15|nr:hypothetical protein [Actinobacillus vicugnae]
MKLTDGTIIKVKKQASSKEKLDELVWYRDVNGVEQKPPMADDWRIFSGSYQILVDSELKELPLLLAHNVETETDKEVVLAKPIAIKAGTELGLIGEYNQMDEQDKKLLHLEVFTYDDIEAFKVKAKVQYEKDKAEKKLTDNFLYVARDSAYYGIAENNVSQLGNTVTEIMVPLSEVEKKTIKDGKASKDYYNIQPYLHNTVKKSKAGIYVDDSHVTHGILFPGVNVFHQQSDKLSLFKNGLHEYLNPASGLTIQQKEELDPLFKAIMDELDLDADKGTSVVFEAGKLRDVLLDSVQQRRLTGIIAKHESEWKSTRQADFAEVCALYRQHGKEDIVKRLSKRVEDLSIKLKVNQFDTDKEACYIHPLGMIGWLSVIIGKMIDREYFFAQYEQKFNKLTSAQKVALEAIFTGIEEYCDAHKNYNCDLRKVAYMLATAKHETGHSFEPVIERGNKSYFNKYDPVLADTKKRREIARKMGNVNQGDGYKYRGRGYVQLTRYNNYKNAGNYLGLDLINDQSLALEQKNATKIMIYGMEVGMFTDKKFSDYINDSGCDYKNARRIINGLDKADVIAGYADKLEGCLRWL